VVKGLTLSKQKVKDMTRTIKQPEKWEAKRQAAIDAGFGNYVVK